MAKSTNKLLLCAQNQLESTYSALSKILQDYRISTIMKSIDVHININAIEYQLVEQINTLKKQIDENLIKKSAQAFIASSPTVFTHRTHTSRKGSDSQSLPDEYKQPLPAAGAGPRYNGNTRCKELGAKRKSIPQGSNSNAAPKGPPTGSKRRQEPPPAAGSLSKKSKPLEVIFDESGSLEDKDIGFAGF